VLMLSGIKLIDFAGATYVIAVGAVVAVLALAGWTLLGRRAARARDPRPEAVS